MPPRPLSLQSLLRTPANLRPLLYRSYYSYEHVLPPPYPPAETAILSSALQHVRSNGFTQQALILGAKDAGYLDVSANLFRKGAFELVLYHLVTQRLALKDRVQFVDEKLGVGRKVRSLVMERLRANAEAGVVGRWQEVSFKVARLAYSGINKKI